MWVSGQLPAKATKTWKNKNRCPLPLPENELCLFVSQSLLPTENDTSNSSFCAESEGKV